MWYHCVDNRSSNKRPSCTEKMVLTWAMEPILHQRIYILCIMFLGSLTQFSLLNRNHGESRPIQGGRAQGKFTFKTNKSVPNREAPNTKSGKAGHILFVRGLSFP